VNHNVTYIFEDNQKTCELRRLRQIESALDPFTQSLLAETGVGPGWECLEVGAGGGSILRWLGERVGPKGRALGVDKKTEYLKHFSVPPFEIIEGDVLELKLPGHSTSFMLDMC
jgi:ubiquinone/menaquinone biosynthesis C-methylase UbiE